MFETIALLIALVILVIASVTCLFLMRVDWVKCFDLAISLKKGKKEVKDKPL